MRETGEPENNETILLSVGGMSCLKIVHSARCPLLSGKHFIVVSTPQLWVARFCAGLLLVTYDRSYLLRISS